jgi:hypothetical protein
LNKGSSPPGAFDTALRAIVNAPKPAVQASIARERVEKRGLNAPKGGN